ncbi:TIGR03943 family protein [Actinoplanes sp. NBRC 103695]|uniref:TIGR03943 family putative permease subunit n=1 Tax=Actinoplanes sp. NBRC 103695 TaxID=3032202 RepID=UPI0024A016B7|nr:TIGR03943 family protein [Actinoplanes sp. NBRC 103695]GLY93938.1 membrane protein [Actinoplanes sp. NBRC 103695]
MNRLAQAVVMLLFGGAIIRATLTDLFLRYVKEGLRPFLLLTGALLVAAAVMTIWYELRALRHRQEDPDDGHGHHEPRVGWLLILPVVGLLLIAPPALGAFSAGQAGSIAAEPSDSDYPPLPPGDPVSVGMLDYASRAVFDGGKSLSGRTVRLTGFITPGPGGAPMLARMVLNCCAADGRPIKVGLTGDTTVDAAPDTWVRIDGVYSSKVGKDPVNGAKVAYLEVKSWQETTEPAQPYA